MRIGLAVAWMVPMRSTHALVSSLALAVVAIPPTQAHAAGKPDLRVGSLKTAAAKVAQGSELQATWKLRNAGAGAAKGSTVHILLSKDAKVDKKDTRLVAAKAKGLAARKTAKLTTAKLLVPRNVAPGDYRLIVCADGPGKVKEASERNNCATAKVTVTVAASGGPVTAPPVGDAPSRPAPGNENLPPAPTPPDDKPGDKPG